MITNKNRKTGLSLCLVMLAGLALSGCDNQASDFSGLLLAMRKADAPSHLTYVTTSAVYTIHEVIADNMPAVVGEVTEWSVDPELPAGLELDSATGAITGTPELMQSAAEYRVTARNDYGKTKTVVSITVNDAPPAALSYATTACVYTVDLAIAPNTPTVTGTVTSWTVSPALQSGLSLDEATGVISGTPDTEEAAAQYIITAANSYGSTSTAVSITVNHAAPAALSYATTAAVYLSNEAIADNVPTVTGTVASWSVDPELPAGLSLDPVTGVITGIPYYEQPAEEYTITARNSGGSTLTTISITVDLTAPSALTYSATACVYTAGLVIANNMPTVTGTVTSWSVDPALPHGLTLNTTTGVISGTPDTEQTATLYTIMAGNSIGFTSTDILITVNLAAPAALLYSNPNAVYTKDIPINPNTPTITGTVTNWSVSPALPSGLVMNTTTGVISGTPDTVQEAAFYTITATNSGGSTTASVSVTINTDAPMNLSYSTPDAVYTKDLVIIPNMPGITGSVSTWSVDPALPAGLTLNTANGVISGTPTTEQVEASYTITATNSAGPTTATIYITVNLTAPANLSYLWPKGVYITGIAISSNTPTVAGTVASYSADKALPDGLVLNTTTGEISGTPTAEQAEESYTITATNSGGSTTVTISIVVQTRQYPRFAYVVDQGDNAISIYTVKGSTGQLRPKGYVSTVASPRSITVDPKGRFAYLTDYATDNISIYMIDQTTGALTAGTAVAAGTCPDSITIDPTGRFAYTANYASGTISVFTIDQATGALTTGAAVAAGALPASMAIDLSGRFAYVANTGDHSVSVYSIDQTTGALAAGSTAETGTSPQSIAITPTGRFAYAANSISNTISVYTVNQSTGALTAGTAVSAGSNPRSIAVDSSGRFVYAANYRSNTISVYTINQATGALTAGTAVATGTNPLSIKVDPSGLAVYVVNNYDSTVSVYSINQSTGALTLAYTSCTLLQPVSISYATGASELTFVPKFAYAANTGSNSVSVYTVNQTTGALTTGTTAGTGGAAPYSVAVDPFGRFAYAANFSSSNVSVFRINQTTGALTAGTAVSAGTNPYSVAVDPTGRFAYTANYGSNNVSVYTINQTTGALTAGTAVSAGTNTSSVTVDPTGRFVYATNYNSNNVSVYRINQTTGALTAGTAVSAGGYPYSVAVDPSGKFAYVANYGGGTVSVYTINPGTGALTAGTAVSAGPNPYSVTVDPTGRFVYAANYGGNTISIYTINPITGALTAGTAAGSTTNPSSITVELSGRFAYVANYSTNIIRLFTINQTTGALAAGSTYGTGTNPRSVVITGVMQ